MLDRHALRLAVATLTVLASALPSRVAADDRPLSADPQVQARIDQLVPLHPAITGYAGIGFTVAHAGSASYGLSGAARIDSNALPKLWGSAKLRLVPGGKMTYQGDASVGYVLSSDRDLGTRTWKEKIGERGDYDLFRVYGKQAIIRSTFVVSAGVKSYTVEPPDGKGGGQLALTAALQYHDTSHFGDHTGHDVAVLYSPSGGFGVVYDVYLSLPVGNPRFTVGGQLGVLPVDGKKITSPTVIEIKRQYVIALELGWSFGN
jgi:hypothetical protein